MVVLESKKIEYNSEVHPQRVTPYRSFFPLLWKFSFFLYVLDLRKQFFPPFGVENFVCAVSKVCDHLSLILETGIIPYNLFEEDYEAKDAG